MSKFRAYCTVFLAVLIIATTALTGLARQDSPSDIDARVEQLLEEMTVEERVGQLFIVDFVGRDTSDFGGIGEFIREYRIGGVVLMWQNNNIANDEPDTVAQMARLSNGMQRIAHRASVAYDSTFIPLFIAVDHEGDGIPRAHLRNGFTPMPSAMAIGATWRLEDAESIGAIVGREFSAVGVNMLMGPVVDVLANPRPEGSGDINIRAFGGDPYWVGQMGRAYIRGVHEGSDGRVLTVAKHFPGHGSSDRLPDDEIATVNRSLAELRESDLIPFFEVTRADPDDPLGTTDAMMPSHIRYRGFQEDVNQLTRPISLDPAGMAAFMELHPLAQWREGGLVVCDSLGVDAIKSYYDPTLTTFPHKQVAEDALMAGNDVLPLIGFSLDHLWFGEQIVAMRETVTYFQERYRSNAAFRERVDRAVRHILRAKLTLYPDLSLESVLVNEAVAVEVVGRGSGTVDQVAEHALTLLYPSPEELRVRLPRPPRLDQNILIAGCFEKCLTYPKARLQADHVRDSLLRLYGPEGNGQVDPERVSTLDYDDLYKLLTDQVHREDVSPDDITADDERLFFEEAEAIEAQIQEADWIILTLINYMPDTNPQTGAARLFLRSTDFDLRDKEVVAISFHAPYYLDATEISKLSAYWVVYSKVEPCVEVSWRALFQGMEAHGASPVSVEGISYDLETQLSPDPAQDIQLTLLSPSETPLLTEANVVVKTSLLVDRNGHTVRDGTVVRFEARYPELDVHLSPRVVTGTVGGSAEALFQPTLEGDLEIVAHADDAASSPLHLSIGATTAALEPSPSAGAPASPTSEAVVETPLPELGPAPASNNLIWIVGVIVLAVVAAVAFGLWHWWRTRKSPTVPVAAASPGPITPDETTGSIEFAIRSLVGQKLDGYEIKEKIGQGGMGQVYKGYQPLLDRTVAIKVLPVALVESEEMRGRFHQEARIAANLRHPNIIQVHDFGVREDMIYMVMEHVDGQTLKEHLRTLNAIGGRLLLQEVLQITRQVADALSYAHAHGAIHRDVKPANILLTQEGQPILADFGLAVLRGGPRYTAPGALWGSPAYMAPELFKEHEADQRSDIYALGIVLYEMLAGRPPFESESPADLIWQQTSADLPRPSERVPDLPEEVEAVILRLLAKDPAERYASAGDLIVALDAVLKRDW